MSEENPLWGAPRIHGELLKIGFEIAESTVSLLKTLSNWLAVGGESEHHRRMIAIGLLFIRMLCDCFRTRQQLEAEILVLRHQLNILRRRAPRRPRLSWADHALFICLYRSAPRALRSGPPTLQRRGIERTEVSRAVDEPNGGHGGRKVK